MPATVYPTDADVLQFLIDSSVLASGSTLPTSLTGIAAAASAAWESDTGYTPFYVATGTAVSARTFDPPRDSRLFLDGGITTATGLIVSVSGSVQTINSNFYVEPVNFAARGVPIDTIRFTWYVTGLPQSISVTGQWGYCISVPADAFQAILRKAACSAHEAILKGSVSSEKQDDVEFQYSVEAGRGQYDRWGSTYKSVLAGYRQVRY